MIEMNDMVLVVVLLLGAVVPASTSANGTVTMVHLGSVSPLDVERSADALRVQASDRIQLRFSTVRHDNHPELPGWMAQMEFRAWSLEAPSALLEVLLLPSSGEHLPEMEVVRGWIQSWAGDQLGMRLRGSDLTIARSGRLRGSWVHGSGLVARCGAAAPQPGLYLQATGALSSPLSQLIRKASPLELPEGAQPHWLGISRTSTRLECIGAAVSAPPGSLRVPTTDLVSRTQPVPHELHLQFGEGSNGELGDSTCIQAAPRLLSRTLEGSGAHREVVTKLDLPPRLPQTCLTLTERLPRGAFVDPYEIQDRERLQGGGALRRLSQQAVDLESAAHNALPELFRLEFAIQAGQRVFEAKVPIHARYGKPSADALYDVVHLPPVLVSLGCECPYTVPLTPDAGISLRVPLGQLQELPVVVCGTLVVTVVGAMVLVHALLSTPGIKNKQC
eukprot:TRINITY_DN21902_c0_g1_i2.p1 TRINITY_DN21902_c0_g1~~TRINITY_DN21902_c0_g1_i2.p1  ORF type:complete len:447 (+),score=54.50 TRINITY_DN21902_c0_g1_i2:176-1516(+)